MKLTQRRIETLECPAGAKDALVFDDKQRGLGVRVTTGGGESYVAQYTFAGSKRRVPLGSCSAISLAVRERRSGPSSATRRAGLTRPRSAKKRD